MRRKFFTAFAGVVSFLMIGAMTASAADITFGGRIRPRYEYWNLQGQDAQYIDMLTRLNAKAKISDNASAFIQLQANSRWGSVNAPGLPATFQNGFRSSNALSGNDTTTDVGIHQAYFTLNKFFGAPVDLQVGRQEIILDGHRLFGNTVWTQGMMSHDAAILNHSHGNHTIKYIYSANVEQSSRGGAGGAFTGTSTDDVDDTQTHALWANFQKLIGENSSTSVYLVYVDSDCNSPGAAFSACLSGSAAGSADFYTIGARQAGGFGDFTYRGEFYYQIGKSGLVNATAPGTTGDMDAFMFGLRAGYKAKNVAMKPGITLWFDYLSGTSAADLGTGDIGTFNTLFDTGHKYYGLMDFFIHNSLGAGTGSHPLGGLIDYAVKLSLQPMAKTTLKVDWHLFQVAEDDVCGSCAGPTGTRSSTLGNEIDVTLVHKYSPSTKISLGYSHMFANDLLSDYNGGARVQNFEDADWLYVMFDVMF